MNIFLWILLVIAILVVGYFAIFFIIKFIDEMRYGNGIFNSIKNSAASCCAVIKDAIRN